MNDDVGKVAGKEPGRGPATRSLPGDVADDAVVEAWAASGAMSLTGRTGAPPLGPPKSLVPKLVAVAERLRRLSSDRGITVDVDPLSLLGERAAIAGLHRNGDRSCGGASRLLPVVDGWLALSLLREDDVAAVPAWLELDAVIGRSDDPWSVVADEVANRSGRRLVERASLLGLPVAMLPPTATPIDAQGQPSNNATRVVRRTAVDGPPAPPVHDLADVTVVDLSALWAGPLCASLLGLAGARVVKVESTDRPDGARAGPPAFFDLLNAGKRSVALDFRDRRDVAVLRSLLEAADVVVEASRPRALEQLGIVAHHLLRAGGPRVWVSITGYGRTGSGRHRVAFGDDAAVAGGLVVSDQRGPCFCCDAVADPTSGLVAATSGLHALIIGGRWILDVAMANVAAHFAGPTLECRGNPEALPPRARRPGGRAAALGEHTNAVVAEHHEAG